MPRCFWHACLQDVEGWFAVAIKKEPFYVCEYCASYLLDTEVYLLAFYQAVRFTSEVRHRRKKLRVKKYGYNPYREVPAHSDSRTKPYEKKSYPYYAYQNAYYRLLRYAAYQGSKNGDLRGMGRKKEAMGI